MPNAANVEVQVGLAKIYGMWGGTAAAPTTPTIGLGTATMESADFAHDFTNEELVDAFGNVETAISTKETYDITISFMPNGATRALAGTALGNLIPAPQSKVTLSNFVGPSSSTGKINGDWRYIGGGTIKLTPTGPVVMGLRLRADIANRTALCTTAAIVG